ncbi:MAG: bacterial transcriptional activator domain-containing protein [Chloroflexota bacterium]
MRRLHFSLLGEPQIFLDDELFELQGLAKVQAIAYYLSVMQEPTSRNDLADLLWPNVENRIGRRYLSQHLVELREQLEDFLVVTSKSLALLPPPAVTVDLHQIASNLSRVEDNPESMVLRRQAIGFYRGPFLKGFKVSSASTFDQWVETTNEAISGQILDALYDLAEWEIEAGNAVQAHEDLDRLLEIVPWHEATHRLKMLLLARQAQYSAAIEQYQFCRRRLTEELNVEPSPETEALLVSIRSGEIKVDEKLLPDAEHATDIERTQVLTTRKLPSYLRRSTGSPPIKRHVAPAPLTELLDRDELLELGIGYLRDPTCRLVTAAGM